MSGFRGALGFLTVLPFGVAATADALWWFPAVGAALGLLVGVVWWVAHGIVPPGVAAVVALVADAALTGLLHVDGLADAADGLLPPLSRQRRLEVMAAPDVGAFGVAAVVLMFLARWAALAALAPSILLLAALWTMSRTMMAGVMLAVPYARGEGGLAQQFLGGGRSQLLGITTAGGAAALLLGLGWRRGAGPIVVVAGVAAGAALVAFAQRRIGGFTGDVLGAAAMAAETIGLVVSTIRW